MKTYLSKEKIKSISNQLNSLLPKNIKESFIFWENKGVNFDYVGNLNSVYENKAKVWHYIKEEFIKNQSPEISKKVKQLLDRAMFEDANNIIQKEINAEYNKHYNNIKNIDFAQINFSINGVNTITSNSHLHKAICISEIIHSENVEKYLTEKYGEQTIPKENINKIEHLAKMIDDQFMLEHSKENYYKYKNAVAEYMITGDKNLLHNLIFME